MKSFGAWVAPRERHAGWVLAIALVLAALAGTTLLKRAWDTPTFLFFGPAIAIAAWRCGRGPTLLATALSLVLIDWFFLPPAGSFKIGGSRYNLDSVAFLIFAATIIIGMGALHRARVLAEQRARELESVATALQREQLLAEQRTGELEVVATRAAKLLDITGALSAATTTEEVTDVVLNKGLPALEAARGALVRVDGKRVEALGLRGYPPAVEAVARGTTPTVDVPILAALRTGEDVWLGSLEEYRRRFPQAYAQYGSVSETQSIAAVRLVHLGETIGGLSLSFDGPAAFGVVDRAFTLLLAQATAAALHRALGYDAERERRREAEVRARVREEVLGVVAHDLRNPLNLISTATQLVIEEDLAPDVRSEMLGRCLRAAKQMNRLISDLLDAARLQAGRLSIDVEDVPVAAIIQQVEDTFCPLAEAQGIKLHAEGGRNARAVRGDPLRISQVLGNLIGNALKFTPAGGTVTLHVRDDGDRVLFQVADTGHGIAPTDLEHVFQDFWQARKGDSRGVGLGLAIAKPLVEMQGGTIWAESTLEVGSTFSFTLPAATASALSQKRDRPVTVKRAS